MSSLGARAPRPPRPSPPALPSLPSLPPPGVKGRSVERRVGACSCLATPPCRRSRSHPSLPSLPSLPPPGVKRRSVERREGTCSCLETPPCRRSCSHPSPRELAPTLLRPGGAPRPLSGIPASESLLNRAAARAARAQMDKPIQGHARGSCRGFVRMEGISALPELMVKPVESRFTHPGERGDRDE